jgi:GDP-L-fucose synthase
MQYSYSLENKRVFVCGHRGMVGKAMVRRMTREPCNILTATRSELDLRDERATQDWFKTNRPDVVILAAARVGGILANQTYPVQFLEDNLRIQTNVISTSFSNGVSRLLFLGSSCVYPKLAKQPILESSLLTGPLEETNQWYAIAKIAGILLCQAYRQQHGAHYVAAMPSNLYGPGDNYHPENSHVMAALIRKIHAAKEDNKREVLLWGTGTPLREFTYVDDLADACVHILKYYDEAEPINVGSGTEVSIFQLAQLISSVVGWDGNIKWDPQKPDGTPRKLMDTAKLRDSFRWQPSVSIESGIAAAYSAFLQEVSSGERF